MRPYLGATVCHDLAIRGRPLDRHELAVLYLIRALDEHDEVMEGLFADSRRRDLSEVDVLEGLRTRYGTSRLLKTTSA